MTALICLPLAIWFFVLLFSALESVEEGIPLTPAARRAGRVENVALAVFAAVWLFLGVTL